MWKYVNGNCTDTYHYPGLEHYWKLYHSIHGLLQKDWFSSHVWAYTAKKKKKNMNNHGKSLEPLDCCNVIILSFAFCYFLGQKGRFTPSAGENFFDVWNFYRPHPKDGTKVMFSLCLSVHTWRLPKSQVLSRVLSRGYPSPSWGGVPLFWPEGDIPRKDLGPETRENNWDRGTLD